MKTKVYSVRISEMREISPKAVKITAFDGSSDIFPKSAVLGWDDEVGKCEAVWIAAWILPKKGLQYSDKKVRFMDDCGRLWRERPVLEKEYHAAPAVNPVDNNEIDELRISE